MSEFRRKKGGVSKTGLYFITISPKYRLQDPLLLFHDDIRFLRPQFNKFSNHYIIYPEFSDQSRLHYHGIIYINNTLKYNKSKWRIDVHLGFMYCRYINDHKENIKSILYSSKQWGINKSYFKEPFIYQKDGTKYKEPMCVKYKRLIIHDRFFNNQEDVEQRKIIYEYPVFTQKTIENYY